jgi:YhcH/YjgK/YiaL family protein
MILDQLKNARLYFSTWERISKALQYLRSTDFSILEPGRYDIDGENIYALVSVYNTKPLSSAKWEAHKKYIDIQYVASGKEKMGVTSSDKVIPLEDYSENNDCTIYKGDGNYILVDEGSFAVFFPTDIHMPGLSINLPKEVKKVVIKVKVEGIESIEEKIEKPDPIVI